MRPRAGRWLVVAAALVLLACIAYWTSRPQRVSGFIVARIADALGLEITAGGAAEYRLRGTPRLVLRDVVARRHGDAPLLRAERIDVSLPWSTLRARGADLTIARVELDRPQLDLPALQRWLATRPPSETRVPRLTDGLHIRDGSVAGDGWRIEGIAVDLPKLLPDAPLRARVRGRYADPPTAMPFDLAIAMTRPANAAGIGIAGTLAVEGGDWRLPARVSVSGPLHVGGGGLRIAPARIGIAARYRGGEANVPFALGAHGPLVFDKGVWSLAPAGLALRGRDLVPQLDARGALALGQRLVLQLQGRLVAWPDAWPALPPPVGQSRAPLPFVLDYAGKPDLSDAMSLQLQRDETEFDGRFRIPEITSWLDQQHGTPLPPLAGRLSTPRLEVSGATLEGVEVILEDDAR